MFLSVEEKVTHKRPRPTRCDACNGPNVRLENRRFMKMRDYGKWPLVWRCVDCQAMVSCHMGTDIPTGRLADAETRNMRRLAHEAFDPLWMGRSRIFKAREGAYAWMSRVLNLPETECHISMLNLEQCELLIKAVALHRKDRAKAKRFKSKVTPAAKPQRHNRGWK